MQIFLITKREHIVFWVGQLQEYLIFQVLLNIFQVKMLIKAMAMMRLEVLLASISLGIDPLDLELDHLIDYINYLIHNFCIFCGDTVNKLVT